MVSAQELPIVELFGPTIQGEGPGAGLNASFLRFGGCNLSCSWCDTPYSWDGERFNLRAEITPMSVSAIVRQLPPATICVVTGGEPLLYQSHPLWIPLLTELALRYSEVHLETNGTIAASVPTVKTFTRISVSPKQAHAGEHRGRQNPRMDNSWSRVPQAVLKIVVRGAIDVVEAADFGYHAGFEKSRIWVMPEGISSQVLNDRWPEVVNAAARLGINATQRLHVLAWADTRGH